MAKPRDTFGASLCFIDVSNCARLRPFRLSGPCGGVCATQFGNPVDSLLPPSPRACVLTDVKMNDRSEPQEIKGPRGGFSPGVKPRTVNAKGLPPPSPE